MAAPLNSLSFFLAFSHLLLTSASHASQQCDDFHASGCSDPTLVLPFPFTYSTDPSCGIFHVNCRNGSTNQFEVGGSRYIIKGLLTEDRILQIQDAQFNNICNNYIPNFTLPNSPFVSFELRSAYYDFVKCNRSQDVIFRFKTSDLYNYTGCNGSIFYYFRRQEFDFYPQQLENCSFFTYPLTDGWSKEFDDLPYLISSGFPITWYITPDCAWTASGKFICSNPGQNGRSHVHVRKIAIGASVTAAVVLTLVIFFLRQGIHWSVFFCTKEHKDDQAIEKFLKSHGSLVSKRFHYSDLKKMTNSFKDKLGQGGFGGVFKGKLQDGRLVAVKVLSSSKCNGEEFMNEVASIGRTNHVNIVGLLGFCSNRSKRALIYEFMPNGSLEQFIYEKTRKANPLGWKKLYEIAVGIARGLEYLHRGCSTRIVHLDVKPHNILLDADFQPKISDFGLAKICPPKESFVSMLGARGTVGYIAPEVFCRNFRGVSHKSDVYSYGMMVLEMVGGRRNIEATAEKTSQIYFPDWIYKRIELNEHLDLHGITVTEEEEISRRMIIVAMWCIQVNPADRPTTSRVVEMLEGSVESLPIPPRPFLSSPSRTPRPQSPVQTS